MQIHELNALAIFLFGQELYPTTIDPKPAGLHFKDAKFPQDLVAKNIGRRDQTHTPGTSCENRFWATGVY